jgi:signal transduction histidine kinase
MTVLRRLGAGIATAAVAALAAVTLVNAHRHPDQTLGGGDAPALVLEALAIASTWTAGFAVVLRARAATAGWLLAAAAVGLCAGTLPQPESGGPLLFALALTGAATAPALAGSAALAHPGGRARPLDLAVGAAALAATFLLLGLLPAALLDPRTSGCFTCPGNPLLVHGDAELHDSLVRAGLWASAAACALLAVLAAVRAAGRPALRRSMLGPVAVGGALTAAAGAVLFTHDATLRFWTVDGTTQALWLVVCSLLALTGVGVAVQAIRARLLRDRIAGMVAGALPEAGELRDAMARALGDPGLGIVFSRPGAGAIDAEGRRAADSHAAIATDVTRAGEVIAQLRHTAPPAPERVAQVAEGAALGLERAALRANARAELTDLMESRVRIVEVGDAERRRLERNLHDGAQQRLIALSVGLQTAGDADSSVCRARADLSTALDSLRAIAHGLHPVSLTEGGLASALGELAESSRVPLRINAVAGARPPAAVESAAYRLVLDAVRCAERRGNGGAVTVEAAREGATVRVRVVVPGVPVDAARPALEHAVDRVTALAGEIAFRRGSSETVVEATLPCG